MDAIPRAASLMATSDHIETWAFGLAMALSVALTSRSSLYSFNTNNSYVDSIPTLVRTARIGPWPLVRERSDGLRMGLLNG